MIRENEHIRMETCGDNIYITPVSDEFKEVLKDDKLRKEFYNKAKLTIDNAIVKSRLKKNA